MAPVRFGHCARCKTAIPADSALCSHCADGSIRLLQAMAIQTQRDQRSWDRRQEAAISIYLLALVVAFIVAPPTWEIGGLQPALFAAGLVASIGALGWLVAPKTRRPR